MAHAQHIQKKGVDQSRSTPPNRLGPAASAALQGQLRGNDARLRFV